MTGPTLDLVVGAVAHGGHCVARHEGRVVFVRHALPGERVRATVTSGEPGDPYWRADAVEVLEASPDRVVAPCPYAGPGRCGGCDWQHATPAAQRRLKAAVVAEQMRRLAGLDVDPEVEELPGAPQGLGWRTRVTYAVDGAGRPGLRRHRSHDVVPVEHCLIAHPQVAAVGVERHRWPGAASVEVVASSGGDRTVVVRPADTGARLRLPRLDPEVSVLVDTGDGGLRRVRGRTRVREEGAGRSYRVTGGGFWQVHPAAADTLVAAVLDGLRPVTGEAAVDLYSGVGLFAGAIAERVGPGGSVLAVEGDGRAAADARRNLHDLPQVRLVAGRVDRTLRAAGMDPVDLVVLDPPRTGAGRHVVHEVSRLRPRSVAYVACDPAALARDVATFGRLGYRLDALRALDLFPMTHHVECVALLAPDAGRP
ncbi:MAG TPA: class I SAM-dependent RNA methyltransferase [Jiangellales bacterium]|nr:class I SAM-dependent RNA methyltransferase [Jiangellales bacterium]